MKKENPFKNIITTDEELRALVGHPSKMVQNKAITYLDEHCANFISKSPFLVMSTSDEAGFCDVSPRGDGPGFVLIIDENHIVIPERPGNKRVDSIRNILTNPKIGLLFLLPGLGETLRVNGKATIVWDEDILSQMEVKGKKPMLGIGVEVDECFIHCAAAFKRSQLWNPESWAERETLPSGAKILSDHMKLPEYTKDRVEKILKDSYENELY